MTQTMQWTRLLSSQRLANTNNTEPEQARSPFHKDYDRIIFSASFRQLNRKTQVHPLTQHDAIHTRLTHSLEVSCIGRSLGMMSAEKIQQHLPQWIDPVDIGTIIQAACLAHDIGNPPFGHAGEYAIREWFDDLAHHNFLEKLNANEQSDIRQFEGNAQGLRLLTRLGHYTNNGGMRLTYATLGAYLKYPYLSSVQQLQQSSHQRSKFGCYQSEKEILKDIAEHLGLIQLGEYHYCRHPLTYLLEAADDICYALIDLEDGIRLNMLSYAEVEPIFIQLIADYGLPEELSQDSTWQQKISALRGRAMKRLINEVSSAFAEQHHHILRGELEYHLLHYCKDDIAQGINAAKNLAREKIFGHPQKSGLELVAYQSIQHILSAFIPLTLPHKTLNFKEQHLMSFLKHHHINFGNNHYQNIMQVLDMLSHLSDHQAYSLAQELQGNHLNLK